jgi:hypothetical protein
MDTNLAPTLFTRALPRVNRRLRDMLLGEHLGQGWAWKAWWQRRGHFIITLAGFASTPAGMRSVRLVEQSQPV